MAVTFLTNEDKQELLESFSQLSEEVSEQRYLEIPTTKIKGTYLAHYPDINVLSVLSSSSGSFLWYANVEPEKRYKLVLKNSTRCRVAYTNKSPTEIAVNNQFSTYFFENDNENVVDVCGDGRFSAILIYAGNDSQVALYDDDFFSNVTSDLVNTPAKRYNLIHAPNGIPSTSASYHALWDKFVDDGYATRETLCEPNGKSVYLYHINFNGAYAYDTDDVFTEVYTSSLQNKPVILLDSGIHGNEKASPLWLYEFVNRLCYDAGYSDMLSAYEWYIVPIVNPTGYDAGTRNNYQNIDINRDNENLNTVEAKALKGLLDARHYDFYFDIHQLGAAGNAGSSPNICSTISVPYGATQENMDYVYKRFMQAGTLIDKGMADYYKKPLTQSCFPWQSNENETFRNYAADKADVVACIEFSKYCYKYSGSGAEYNGISLVYGNSLLDKILCNFFKELL